MTRIIFDKNSKMLGCDISKWQGKVDFFKMKKAGIQFVIIRAGWGTTEDPNFKAYIDGAKKAGIHIGVYWFLYGGSIAKGTDNADKCISVIMPYKSYISLGVWADWEYDSDEKAGVVLTPNGRSSIVRVFLKQLDAAGFTTGIYANRDYIKSGKFTKDLIAAYPLWYALYGASNYDFFGCTGKGGYPLMWQFTSGSKGSVYGVSSDTIDLDYGYFKIEDTASSKPVVRGVTVDQFIPTKGAKADWVNIISNLKQALNTTFGLSFPINRVIDEMLLLNLANVELTQNNPLTDMNYVLQQILVWWGYDLKIDGVYGLNTWNTIKTFQAQTGLVPTGTTTSTFWRRVLGK